VRLLRLFRAIGVYRFRKADWQPLIKRKREEFVMNTQSAVEFSTNSRIHLGLAVKNLKQSRAFYRTLFGEEPSKIRPHYTKFEMAEPPVNLSLNEVDGQTGPNHPVSHFGIQVKSNEAVKQVAERLSRAGIATQLEEHVTCCYAVQNKVWASDPDGNKWEVYVVLDNDGAHHHSSAAECCPAPPETEKLPRKSHEAAPCCGPHSPVSCC
jgi:catechol 2,3-dioxygenase-like lactoylglutathione lyase family enzyme